MLNKIKSIMNNKNVKMILAAIVLFAGVLVFVPSASVLRSFPVLVISSCIALVIHPDKKTLCFLSFVLTFCMYSVYGFSIALSFVYGVLSAVITLLSAACLSSWYAARKGTKKAAVRAYRTRFVILVLVTLSAYFAVCADPYSTIAANSKNTEYITESYGDDVKPTVTYYSLSDFGFRTCVEFEDNGVLTGHDKEIYVNVSSKGIYDGVREYIEDNMLENSEKALASVLSTATDAYDVIYSDIAFSDGELLSFDAKSEEYFDRTNYVVGLYSIIENKHDFEMLATDCAKALLSAEAFDFECVTLCAGSAEEALYSVSITPSTQSSDIKSLILDFDSKNVELFGVTQNDFLKYWN